MFWLRMVEVKKSKKRSVPLGPELVRIAGKLEEGTSEPAPDSIRGSVGEGRSFTPIV